jgi:AAA15 family ATPase/GTPase
MVIKELRIKNFRSIVKSEIVLNNMSVFVGFNDVGKSNVLKSLNLFFNGETDYEKPLNFKEDYCKHTPFRKKKAEEIVIELIIGAPKNYKGSNEIRWTKVWRASGLYSEDLSFIDGSTFPKKSKLNYWLKNIRFTYVPAIRGASYFEILLAKLHDTLAETIEDELREAGDDFIDKIKSNTLEMTKEILMRMEIQSQIRFPTNLQALFKTLDFATSEGSFNISLSNRGDGIKTRHIPAILKFISDQLNINKVKGSPNVNMIWGYEEPENNLEMLVSYKLADQFIDYTNEIQILITTHSPGFYSLKNKYSDKVNLYKIIKLDHKPAQIVPLETTNILDIDMGIMPIISPYIDQKIIEIEELKTNLELYRQEVENNKKNVLFVEGDDEFRIFTKIIEEQNLTEKLMVSSNGFGCGGVKNNLMSWSWISGTSLFKAIGLFDSDTSGIAEHRKLKEEQQFIKSSSERKVKAITYKVPLHLRNIKNKIPSFPIELEEMFTCDLWKHAKTKRWLEKRGVAELNSFVKLDSTDQTIIDKIDSFGFDTDEKLYVFYKIPDRHKDKMSKHIIQINDYSVFENSVKPLLDIFNTEVTPFIIS